MGYGDCLLLRCDNTSVRDCCRCEGHSTSVLVRLCTTGVGQTASCGIHLPSCLTDTDYYLIGISPESGVRRIIVHFFQNVPSEHKETPESSLLMIPESFLGGCPMLILTTLPTLECNRSIVSISSSDKSLVTDVDTISIST